MLLTGKAGILYISNINSLSYVYIWKHNGKEFKKCRIDKEVHRADISRVSKHDMATVPVEDNEIRI